MAKVRLNGKEYGLNNILSCDFYQVEEDHGKKVVHADGYIWEDPDHPNLYRHTYYCWCYLELPTDIDALEEVAEQCKQYQEDDLTEEEAVALANEYFDGTIIPLPLNKITQDTPCGCYINMEP